MANAKSLGAKQRDELLGILKTRFERYPQRHAGIDWADVVARLQRAGGTLWSLGEMERTGGEPDVTGRNASTGEIVFVDCSVESPAGRRSLCYDQEALAARKEHKPQGSAMEMAAAMGIEMLSDEQYRHLQTLGAFDLKTSSWILTPAAIRTRGGALFCDRRYDTVFTYHNGAESYYAARGFRGLLRI